jgi:Sap, sulfolipid-1-addressing protein
MWGPVLVFAFAAAQDPVRVGITACLISRPRPMPNLFAYWLGLMVTGFGAALAALFLLHDLLLPVMRIVTSAATNPVVPLIQIVVGVLAILTAAMLAAPSSLRQLAHAPMAGGDGSTVAFEPQKPIVFSRLSWRGLLEGRSLGMAFVAGLCTSTQIVEFWGAMMVILASGAAAGTQVSAALMFTLLAFAFVEIPLVSYLASPAKTQAVVMQLHDWLRAHRRPVFAVMLGAFGVLMVTKGVGGV